MRRRRLVLRCSRTFRLQYSKTAELQWVGKPQGACTARQLVTRRIQRSAMSPGMRRRSKSEDAATRFQSMWLNRGSTLPFHRRRSPTTCSISSWRA